MVDNTHYTNELGEVVEYEMLDRPMFGWNDATGRNTEKWPLTSAAWASAHKGKWGQLGSADPPLENWYIHIYSDTLQNAPFRSQIFKIFFASSGKGALTPNQNPADALDQQYRRRPSHLCSKLVHLSDSQTRVSRVTSLARACLTY